MGLYKRTCSSPAIHVPQKVSIHEKQVLRDVAYYQLVVNSPFTRHTAKGSLHYRDNTLLHTPRATEAPITGRLIKVQAFDTSVLESVLYKGARHRLA